MLLLLAIPSGTPAQISPITASGLDTQVSSPISLPTGHTQFNVTGGTRPDGGTNLFHSFGDFNVPTSNIANFLNETALPTSNILGRVTGGNPSSIFGTIQTEGFGNANLFLMNPAGIVFGPNATLNVGGSVAFTTANYLRLAEADGSNAGIFHAETTSASLLTSAPVAAFGFLGTNPSAISVQRSTMNVQPGQSISLIGGNEGFTYANPDTGTITLVPGGVTMTGGALSAPTGQILIASAASPGEILQQSLELGPNVNGDSFTSLGTASISQGGLVDASGDPGGIVRIRSGQFVLDGSSLFANTTGEVDGESTAVQIHAQADATFRNASAIASFSEGAGRSGDIEIKAGTVNITDGSAIFTGSFGSAPASNILITASNSVSLIGTDPFGSGVGSTIVSDSSDFCGCTEPSGGVSITTPSLTLDDQAIIQTRAFGDRRAGDITLDLGNLTVINGSAVQTSGSEFALSGTIRVTAAGIIALSGQFDSDTPSRILNVNEGTAGTGAIVLETGSLSLEGGARIRNEALASLEPGQDPKITIVANDNVNLSGGSNIRVLNVASNVGGIDISGRSITLTDQSVIRTETFGDGNAGPINITASDLSILSGSTVESSTFDNAGLGGDIAIILTGNLGLKGQAIGESGEVISSNISSRTTGSGDGGTITLSANSIEISGGAVINTSTALGTGNAGSVTIQRTASPTQSVLIDGPGSRIFTDTQGTGAGGDITIQTKTLKIQNGGTISAATSGLDEAAIGGDVTVTASKSVDLRNHASISAKSTGDADAGNITINAGRSFEARNNSSVTTKSDHAGGGNVAIDATDQFRLVNSQVNASAFLNGGNVTIDPNLVILQKNSQILAEAIQGNGGNITIFTPLFLADSTSLVSAKSEFGLNGTVTIQSPTSNLSESLGTLTSKPNQAQSLLTQRCAALANGQASSFVVAGREQLPADPGSWLTSPLAFAALGESLDTADAVASAPAVMAIAAHDTDRVSLRRLTPAGFLIANFADSEATGCHS
jgi:filamentous hemagglutinin family protein